MKNANNQGGQLSNVALYCRVAFFDQYAMENQRNIVCSFAEQNGYTKHTEYLDNGFSGISFSRPAFVQMNDDIKAGKVDTIIVKSVCRIARDHSLFYDWSQSPDVQDVKIIAVDGSHEVDATLLSIIKSLTYDKTNLQVILHNL